MKHNAKMTVNVYLDFINYQGEITSSYLIAKFKNENWASAFIKSMGEDKCEISRLRMEVIK